MIDTFSAGGVVLNSQGQVLVVNQDGDSWSLPKGHFEKNESALKAAIREIREESGVSEVIYVKDLGTYQRFQWKNGVENKEHRKNITMFLFTTTQTDLNPIDPENPEARWVDRDKVTDLLSFEKDKEFFRNLNLQIRN